MMTATGVSSPDGLQALAFRYASRARFTSGSLGCPTGKSLSRDRPARRPPSSLECYCAWGCFRHFGSESRGRRRAFAKFCPALARKIFRFRFSEICVSVPVIPSHCEGRIAIVTNAGRAVVDATLSCARGDCRASEARERLRRARRAAGSRTEKSCGSGAPWSASRFAAVAWSPTGLRGAAATD